MSPADLWPRLTAHLPAAGGGLKAVPEDFCVEEIPAYEPTGEGEHLFLWVKKVGRSTPEVAKLLSRHFQVPERDVGYAGLKDRQGVTFQYFSVPSKNLDLCSSWSQTGVSLLKAIPHRNKLKSNHLRGNRFKIRVRDVRDFDAAKACLQWVERVGVPNYYGQQRFGREAANVQWGKALLRRENLPQRPSRFQRKMYLSAVQSELFNHALADRIRAELFQTVCLGDVMKKEDSGGEFVCEDLPEVTARFHQFEVSVTGPLFGPKMLQPQGSIAAVEEQLLQNAQLTSQDFENGGKETQGARRPYRILLRETALEKDNDDVWVHFSLPAGSYATIVLREIFALS